MTKTETVYTTHGEVEYEVVECDSCGMEVRKEDTVPFTIGHTEGVACEDCEEDGPRSFPKRVIDLSVPESDATDQGELGFFIFFAIIAVPLVTVLGWTNEAEKFDEGFAMATTVFLIYGLFFATLWVIL